MPAKKEHQVGRNGGKEIDDPVETENVGPGLPDGDDPKNILYGKNYCNDPLRQIEYLKIPYVQAVHAFQHYQNYTEQNDKKKGDVEDLSCRSVGLINYFMELVLP